MSDRWNAENLKHRHRGKSSERHLNKNAILAGLMIGPGQVVLDAGCGNGYMAKEFARLTGKTGKVYALDTDSTSIEVLKSETEGTTIEPFVGDITEETRLSASSIDLIYVATVIHGFSRTEMEGFLKEADRLMKPNGRLAIVEIKKEDTPFGPPLHIRFSPEELKQLISFTPTQLIDVGQFFYMQTFKKE
ncbi:MAG: class I SAM-dependent methyltransferase [Deltaproteobacteria bacterium]|nr:class I SAM-dependent methyltransferase [Deltaproteobacteria bacterium]